MNEERDLPVVGACSLLVIFAVLCLTVFALLGLSTVQADARLAAASQKAVTAYYAADCQAEELFAALRSGQMPEGVTQEGDTYSYTCPITQEQALEVQLRYADGVWTVLRWQEVYQGQWQADNSLNVWDGEDLP